MAKPLQLAQKLTPKNFAKLLALMRQGYSRNAACGAIGIDRKTLQRHCKADPRVAERAQQADDAGHYRLVSKLYGIATKGKGDKQALMWILERKWFDDWAKRDPNQITEEQLTTAFTRLALLLITKLPTEFHAVVMEAIDGAGKLLRGEGGDDASDA